MKIVVLDGHTANPGDLSWDEFSKLGELEVFERTADEQIIARLQDAAVALTNKAVLDRAAISALPDLRYIGVTATGYNIVDIAAARERGIVVCNVPEYSTPDVAQAVFALLLELTNRTGHHAETVRAGKWSRSQDFCYWDYPLVRLSGFTLGIIGFGRIGRAVARIGLAFGMKILAPRRSPIATDKNDGVQYVELDTLLGESDVVTLHCPLTPRTMEMVNAQFLAMMKPTAFLINTARGGLVDEAALADALNHKRIAGAGLDVLSIEPPPDNPLLHAKNCIITPHIAWATKTARIRLLRVTAENIRAWMNGEPQNVVSP